MRLELPHIEKTPYWQFTPEINQICQPLFEQFDITYFDYSRFYSDKHCVAFSSNPNYVKYLLTQEQYQCAAGLLLPGKHLWMSYIDLGFLHQTTAYFDYFHGITYHHYHEDYVELINFSASKNNSRILSLYLNLPEIFDYFLIHFRELIAPFLTRHHHARILLPDDFLKTPEQAVSSPSLLNFIHELNKNSSLRKNTFLFKIGSKFLPLTLREMQCLGYLAQGLPAKEIARKLNISTRTVEAFLNKLYLKTQVTHRSALLSQLDKETLKLLPSLLMSEMLG